MRASFAVTHRQLGLAQARDDALPKTGATTRCQRPEE